MKIASICLNYPPSCSEGGVSHYTLKLARSLRDLGNEIIIITSEEYCGSGYDENITVIKVPGKWDRQTVREIATKLKSMSIETLNLQYTPSMYSNSFKFFWRYLAKHFVSNISFHTLCGGSKLNYLFALSLLQSSSGIIATNSEIIYLLNKYFPIFRKKAEFIPIGPNIEPVEGMVPDEYTFKKFNIKCKQKIISYFGMAYTGKGLKLLLKAIEILIKSHKLDIKLLIIGGGLSDINKYILEIKDLARKLNIGDRITWTGNIEEKEVSNLLMLSDLVVLPFSAGASDRRGSLLTALAHKKAVITTKPKIPIPLFKNMENMTWPPKSDPDELAKTINRVLIDKQLKARLEYGASKLMHNYKWKEIGMQTHNFMKNVIANNL